MPFQDEVDQRISDLIQEKLSGHIASVNANKPMTPAEENAASEKFAGARRQFEAAYGVDISMKALIEEIDSLRARLDALEGN